VGAERPVLFVNLASGGGKAVRAGILEEARGRGIEVVVLSPGRSLADLVSEAVAAGADVLGMAGGDGSLAAVASAAVENDLPFVCVPAGTRNHFALDLGIDRQEVVRSLDAFQSGLERRIDVAEVNGRVFLNNVSLGVYGEAVRQEAYRDAKLRTLVATAADVLQSSTVSGLRLVDDMGRVHADPALVLVSNNPYAVEPPQPPGTRAALDGGRLGIVVVDRPPAGGPPWRAWAASTFEVTGPAPLHAGVDGEAVELEPPLRFAVRPAALRVRVARSWLGGSGATARVSAVAAAGDRVGASSMFESKGEEQCPRSTTWWWFGSRSRARPTRR